MVVSISTGSLYHLPLRWALGIVADAGFDGIELAIGLEAALRGPTGVRDLAGDRELRVFSLHPPLFPLPGWNNFATTARLMDFAAGLGASVVVQHTPNTDNLASADGVAWHRAMDAARRQGELRGVTLALENRAVFRHYQRAYALSDPESLTRFAEEYDFQLTLDTSHAASWPWDIVELYDLFRDRLVNLHLSDFKPLPAWLDRARLHTYLKHHQLLGAGDLPVMELVRHVRADGYAGPVTLELSPVALRAWSPARLRRNLAATVRVLRDELTSPLHEKQVASPVSRW